MVKDLCRYPRHEQEGLSLVHTEEGLDDATQINAEQRALIRNDGGREKVLQTVPLRFPKWRHKTECK